LVKNIFLDKKLLGKNTSPELDPDLAVKIPDPAKQSPDPAKQSPDPGSTTLALTSNCSGIVTSAIRQRIVTRYIPSQ
jgi:hypothetical protein